VLRSERPWCAAGEGSKHKCQLTVEDPAEAFDTEAEYRAAGGGRGGGRGGRGGRGGGWGGEIGGTGKNKRAGAVGHQRHIDHVYIAKVGHCSLTPGSPRLDLGLTVPGLSACSSII